MKKRDIKERRRNNFVQNRKDASKERGKSAEPVFIFIEF
jgi:hypothetical protein